MFSGELLEISYEWKASRTLVVAGIPLLLQLHSS